MEHGQKLGSGYSLSLENQPSNSFYDRGLDTFCELFGRISFEMRE